MDCVRSPFFWSCWPSLLMQLSATLRSFPLGKTALVLILIYIYIYILRRGICHEFVCVSAVPGGKVCLH